MFRDRKTLESLAHPSVSPQVGAVHRVSSGKELNQPDEQ